MLEKDYEEILSDVSAHFATPADLVAAPDISREQKIALLKQWDYDLQLLLTATEENMTGTGANTTADQVRRVRAAMAELGVDLDPDATGDGKVHTPQEPR
jgi:hypothetical protein